MNKQTSKGSRQDRVTKVYIFRKKSDCIYEARRRRKASDPHLVRNLLCPFFPPNPFTPSDLHESIGILTPVAEGTSNPIQLGLIRPTLLNGGFRDLRAGEPSVWIALAQALPRFRSTPSPPPLRSRLRATRHASDSP